MLPKDRGLGLSLSLTTRWGANANGVDALWREEMPIGAPAAQTGGIDLRIGYGFAVFGDRFTATPNVGLSLSDGGARDYRIGWHLTSVMRGESRFDVKLNATRRESSIDGEPPVHMIMLFSTVRW